MRLRGRAHSRAQGARGASAHAGGGQEKSLEVSISLPLVRRVSRASVPNPSGVITMRFMMLVKSAENSGPPPKELMDAIGKLAEEALKAGTMLDSGGLAPTAMSARVRLARGQVTTTDGPFAESKEVVGGFAVFELKSKKE